MTPADEEKSLFAENSARKISAAKSRNNSAKNVGLLSSNSKISVKRDDSKVFVSWGDGRRNWLGISLNTPFVFIFFFFFFSFLFFNLSFLLFLFEFFFFVVLTKKSYP